MTSSSIDPRIRRTILPCRIIWQEGTVTGADVLLKNDFGQTLVQPAPNCTLQGPGASLLLDFGRELHGSVQLVRTALGRRCDYRA